MASKQVADRTKSATTVQAAARTHAELVDKKVHALLAPYLKKGESMPDFALGFELAARALEARTSEMTNADDAHERELDDDAKPRDARDEAAMAVYAKVVEIAEIVAGLYGRAQLKSLGLDGTTPRDPVQLSHYTRTVLRHLRAASLPKSRIKGASVKGDDTADELEALLAPLDAALVDVARETREAEATLVHKQGAMAAFDTTFSGVATFLGALLALAGEKELAGRVRPSTRRPGRTEQDANSDAPASPAGLPPAPPAI